MELMGIELRKVSDIAGAWRVILWMYVAFLSGVIAYVVNESQCMNNVWIPLSNLFQNSVPLQDSYH